MSLPAASIATLSVICGAALWVILSIPMGSRAACYFRTVVLDVHTGRSLGVACAARGGVRVICVAGAGFCFRALSKDYAERLGTAGCRVAQAVSASGVICGWIAGVATILEWQA